MHLAEGRRAAPPSLCRTMRISVCNRKLADGIPIERAGRLSGDASPCGYAIYAPILTAIHTPLKAG